MTPRNGRPKRSHVHKTSSVTLTVNGMTNARNCDALHRQLLLLQVHTQTKH